MSTALPVGAEVRLQRGQCEAAARVVWRTVKLAGISFDEPITLDDWLLEGSEGQRRVDLLLQPARIIAPVALDRAVPDAHTLRLRAIEELGVAERLFEAVGDALAEIPEVVAGSPRQLQLIEIGCKILRHAADVLASDDPAVALQSIGLHEMKSRLLRR